MIVNGLRVQGAGHERELNPDLAFKMRKNLIRSSPPNILLREKKLDLFKSCLSVSPRCMI
jgi:hypothetical protein